MFHKTFKNIGISIRSCFAIYVTTCHVLEFNRYLASKLNIFHVLDFNRYFASKFPSGIFPIWFPLVGRLFSFGLTKMMIIIIRSIILIILTICCRSTEFTRPSKSKSVLNFSASSVSSPSKYHHHHQISSQYIISKSLGPCIVL